MSAITKPLSIEYPKYFHTYISLTKGADLIQELEATRTEFENTISLISEDKGNYHYTEGKWSIKKLLLHIIDTERIMCYRALSFARGEKAELPGFDENAYAENCEASKRSLTDILEEYKSVRASTISLFKNFSSQTLDNIGRANNNSITVKSIGYIILGHQIHHINVLKERYLVTLDLAE